MKHQLDATLCRFYFCRVTLHVSGPAEIKPAQCCIKLVFHLSYLQEVQCEGLDWLDLDQDKERLGTFLGAVMKSSSPYNAENLLNS